MTRWIALTKIEEEIDALIAQRVSAETARCAKLADAHRESHLAARDRLLLEHNPQGALTRARQAQTAEAIFQEISARAERPAPEPTCEGGVPLGTMGATCPKCSATDNDSCRYMGEAAERPAPPQQPDFAKMQELQRKAHLPRRIGVEQPTQETGQPGCGNLWLPIDSAPQDGSRFLIGFADRQYVTLAVASGNGGFENVLGNNLVEPSHWMPLPASPGALASTGADKEE